MGFKGFSDIRYYISTLYIRDKDEYVENAMELNEKEDSKSEVETGGEDDSDEEDEEGDEETNEVTFIRKHRVE